MEDGIEQHTSILLEMERRRIEREMNSIVESIISTITS